MGARDDDNRLQTSRKIVLIDLENMLFGDHETHALEHDDSGRAILKLAEARRPTDQLIVGCNPHLAFVARDLFPAAQIVTGKGKDGADLALVATIDLARAAERFDELCIVSGDHAFTSVAQQARQAGLTVRVVAPHAGLSTALRLQANTSIFLPNAQDASSTPGELAA